MRQDGVTGTGFTILPETTKLMDKLCETMFFNILDIWQQRALIPENKGYQAFSIILFSTCVRKLPKAGERTSPEIRGNSN